MSINTYNELSEKPNFLSILLNIYMISIGVGLPLVFRHYYFDILQFKYYYYCFCTIAMLVLVMTYYIMEKVKTDQSYLHNTSRIRKKLSLVDYFVIIYWFIAILSTLNSDYLYESFWGNEGRFTGLFLISWYVLSYFCVSRLWNFKEWYLDLILIAGFLVCLFGITDYFRLDIFGFKVNMIPDQKDIFTSTIGNINTYTAYVGIITALSTVLYAKENRSTHLMCYYICMVTSFFAIIMGVSDNAYLTLMALFGLLPIFLFLNMRGIKRYFIIITTFFSVAQCIDWINYKFSNQVIGIDSAFKLVLEFKFLHILVIILWSLLLLWHIWDLKGKNKLFELGNVMVYIWIGIITITSLIIIFILLDCNIAGHASKYNGLSNYFVLNDDWGTHRGYIWRNGLECFSKLTFWKKMIGYGPETFGILILKATANNKYNEIFDSAHNEYLHMLITVGVFGLISYLIFVFSIIKKCFKHKENNYLMAIAFGIICYSAQAFVNLNLPIATPIFWLLISMASAKLNHAE
ncbi:O-antigen ligase-like membrane protein [Lacrimispora xylanisolvens]|uniref:O-antigen ligase-like membrane protein n=1 Tax=Lacrimispora xylanisolvens TaxID=384636 RepID=A0A2S6HZN5_9FIRM|nr:O-antigen ligase family protein [Hungatella xylanolytica]PPK83528.1 O-antigen ligase-like membrane protein [Hungatella xylanolytica]